MPEDTPLQGNDLAEAYKELAKGEQAASALEANLTNLESKLDAILAAFESQTQDATDAAGSTDTSGDKTITPATENENESNGDAANAKQADSKTST